MKYHPIFKNIEEQKWREAKELKRVETILAEKRLSTLGATGGRGNKKGVSDLTQGLKENEQGKARNIVASKLKFTSKREFDRAITTDEFLDNLDMTSYHWENMCRSYWEIFKEILDTGKVNTQLLKNILSEATVSHEQIYELLKTIKGRCKELIE